MLTCPIVITRSTASENIDAAEQEIRAQFTNAFMGWNGITAFDNTLTATTAAELQTHIRTGLNASNQNNNTKVIADWDGILTGDLDLRGVSSSTTGPYDNGKVVYVVPASGKAPAINGNITHNGVRGLHWKDFGFALETPQPSPILNVAYCVTLQSNASFPAHTVVMFEDCIFGPGYWNPAGSNTDWPSAVKAPATVSTVDDVYFTGCQFNGLVDCITCPARKLRIHDCDFQQVIGDCVTMFGHTNDTGYYSYNWMERVTVRNLWPDNSGDYSVLHADVFQTGTSGDVHLGYRNLYKYIVVHGGRTTGHLQGFFNDDLLTADNQFVYRNCLLATIAVPAVTFYSPIASRRSYCDRVTLIKAGTIPSGNTSINHMVMNSNVLTPYPSGVRVYITNCIRSQVSDPQSNITEAGAVVCDCRSTGTVTNAAERPEAVFVNGGSNFARDGGGVLSYTVANEDGTQAQFVASMWGLFEPVTGYRGCPDPRGWF